MNLSENAQKLLAAVKGKNLWEIDAIKVLFPEPAYSRETAADYWQWEANLYGNSNSRPVNGESMVFSMNIHKSYSAVTLEAARELRDNGYIHINNAGYNEYYYKYSGKI